MFHNGRIIDVTKVLKKTNPIVEHGVLKNHKCSSHHLWFRKITWLVAYSHNLLFKDAS